MKIIHLNPKNIATLPAHALTIGNFDGVHLGHQAMLTALKKDAHSKGLATAIMIFEPQPREFFNPDNPPARLTSFDEKLTLLDEFGVDFIIKASFNDEFRQLSAHDFANMLDALGTQHLVLGDDFRFGHDRTGDKYFLTTLGFSVESLATIKINETRVSSTAIRQALSLGELSHAKELLGRDYAMTGQVIHGDKIGRTLDFPTANIQINRLKPALHGIFGADIIAHKDGQLIDLYQCHQTGIKGLTPYSLFGAVNIGTRPSVNGTQYRLEVHLPKFSGDLYGLTLTVIFTKYLHEEIRYPNLESLKAGIHKDVNELLAWRDTHF